MTRADCEGLLLDLLEVAYSVYKCYNPKGSNLTMTCYNGQFSVSDNMTDENGNFINCKNYDKAHSVYITKFADGHILNGSDWRKIMNFGREAQADGDTGTDNR